MGSFCCKDNDENSPEIIENKRKLNYFDLDTDIYQNHKNRFRDIHEKEHLLGVKNNDNNTNNDNNVNNENIKYKFMLPTDANSSIYSIIPYLYIGSYHDASCFNLLKNNNIKKVINLSEETFGNWFAYKKIKIENIQISLNFDMTIDKIILMMDNISLLVSKSISNKENILVHCNTESQNKINTSSTFVMYYIMKYIYYNNKEMQDKCIDFFIKLNKKPNMQLLNQIFL
jgi:hypothetical protein